VLCMGPAQKEFIQNFNVGPLGERSWKIDYEMQDNMNKDRVKTSCEGGMWMELARVLVQWRDLIIPMLKSSSSVTRVGQMVVSVQLEVCLPHEVSCII
jgi:hypothetical protein